MEELGLALRALPTIRPWRSGALPTDVPWHFAAGKRDTLCGARCVFEVSTLQEVHEKKTVEYSHPILASCQYPSKCTPSAKLVGLNFIFIFCLALTERILCSCTPRRCAVSIATDGARKKELCRDSLRVRAGQEWGILLNGVCVSN